MIIDASVALKWLVPEEDSDKAGMLLERSDLLGPTLVHAEVANGLRRKSRQGELLVDSDLAPLMDILASIIQPVDELPVIGRALVFAAGLNHSVYDCVYLALADQLGQELITADLKFLRKVKASNMAHLIHAL